MTQPTVADPTVDYREAPAATVLDPGPVGGTEELRGLLSRRLRFLALLGAGGMVGILGLAALQIANEGRRLPPEAWAFFAGYLLAFLVMAGVAAVLRRPGLSLAALRGLELALFGAMFALWVAVQWFLYPTFRVEPPPVWFPFVLANAVSAPWVLTIILYGVFVPNTWRRCAVVVGVMAVAPLVVNTASGLATQSTAGHSPAYFLVGVATWVATAAAIAVHGAHRIDALRREVLAARRLGQYQLVRCLGSGGMGEVHLAEHVLLKRPCAVKLIRPERAGDPAALALFEREVRATAALTHPNTVQIFDYGYTPDGTFYYAMEYLVGPTLAEVVERHGPLPAGRAVHVLRQVCGALAEAHTAGLVHRDVKPANVVLCTRGGRRDVAKLLDFGLVLTADRLAEDGRIAGTPAYLSPEQAAGRADLDGRSDLYGVGALAYFLLTGRPPFSGRSTEKLLAAHRYEPPWPLTDLRPDVPADLEAVVLRCLAKEPAGRFADADALDRALAGCACAGWWTAEDAAAWWRHHEQPEPSEAP